LVYDLNQKKSKFEKMILPWIELIKNHGLDSAPVIILANKYDKEDEDFGSKELPKISK